MGIQNLENKRTKTGYVGIELWLSFLQNIQQHVKKHNCISTKCNVYYNNTIQMSAWLSFGSAQDYNPSFPEYIQLVACSKIPIIRGEGNNLVNGILVLVHGRHAVIYKSQLLTRGK
jgi:hypothetical protein